MKLHQVKFSLNESDPNQNSWLFEGLTLSHLNLITGKNAAGKTRTINIIYNLAKIISLKLPKLRNGHWTLSFKDGSSAYEYELDIRDQKVKKEIIKIDGIIKLDRKTSGAEIYSATQDKTVDIKPPADKLVLHIRRDESEHPFLEKLIKWAESAKGFRFATERETIEVVNKLENLQSLNAVPSILDGMSPEDLEKIIKDFNTIGYSVENTKVDLIPGRPADFKIIYIKEKGLKHWINQFELSQGMFRAFALLSIVHYFTNKKNGDVLLMIDDFCEGLDYERATQYTKLLFDKVKKHKNIQLICATNDSFMMNVIDIEHWNILIRDGNEVHAKNYENNKEVFDEFKLSGLNNFDLLSSSYLNELK